MDRVIPRIKAPETVSAGTPFTVKTVISHPMETGRRKAANGTPIPRRILHQVTAFADGEEVARGQWSPGIAANPFWEFRMSLEQTAVVRVEWVEDGGQRYAIEQRVEVQSA